MKTPKHFKDFTPQQLIEFINGAINAATMIHNSKPQPQNSTTGQNKMNKSQFEIRTQNANQARTEALNRLITTQEIRQHVTEGAAVLLAMIALGEALALFFRA